MQLWLVFCVLVLAHGRFAKDQSLPEYCASLDYIEKDTKIPKLVNLTLVQVQILARHGGRVPYYRVYCWDKADSPMDRVWNCGPTQEMNQNVNHSTRLYQKRYDTNRNVLNGNCIVGQLLPFGIEQHLMNGKLLKEAYIGEHGLFQTNVLQDIKVEDIYLRSDDNERTLASGQALVDGMFDPALDVNGKGLKTWHTADYATDIINTNEKSCPKLNQVNAEATSGVAFQQYVNSLDAKETENRISKAVGKIAWDTCLECLMISRCNNISLPDGINNELFDKVIQQVEYREYLRLTYNNSAYAKLSTAPLLADFVHRMEDAVAKKPATSKLAIVMAHDSTIMPMLASILGESWDGTWAPYASMLVFELYKDMQNGHKVRVLFKGQPLILPGCDTELCDYNTFYNLTAFSILPRDCSIQAGLPQPEQGFPSHTLLGLVGLVLCSLFLVNYFRGSNEVEETKPLV